MESQEKFCSPQKHFWKLHRKMASPETTEAYGDLFSLKKKIINNHKQT